MHPKSFSFTSIILLYTALFVISAFTYSPAIAANIDESATLGIIGTNDFVANDTTPTLNGLPNALVARITQQLTASKRFTILERSALRRVIVEQRFNAKTPETTIDTLLEEAVENLSDLAPDVVKETGILAEKNDTLKDFQDLGTAAGADYLIFAKLETIKKDKETITAPYSNNKRKITTHKANATLYLRIIESKTGKIIGAESLNTTISDTEEASTQTLALYDTISQTVSRKILDLVFPPRIIGQSPLIINRGTNDGVQLDDRYDIVREGKEVTNNKGLRLGHIHTPIGSIKLSQIQDTFSVATIIEGDIQQNDLALTRKTQDSAPKILNKAAKALTNNTAIQAGNKPRIAIGLVKSGSTARTGDKANHHLPHFTDTLISQLTHTKRFQLIDRQETDQLLTEQLAQALTENRDLPSQMGTLQGADYLLYGSVSHVNIANKTTQLPHSSKSLHTKTGIVQGNIRIVDARSGDIIASRTINLTETLSPEATNAHATTLLADAYAQQAVLSLMNAVYPLKVAAYTADGTSYVNRGSDGGLTAGEVLTAYRLGKAIIDPDTGIHLGQTETLLGNITLTSVDQAHAKGTSDVALHVGDLLKRTAEPAATHHSNTRSGANINNLLHTKNTATLAVGKIRLHSNGKNSLLQDSGLQKHSNNNNLERVTNDLMVKLSQNPHFDVMERQQVDQLLDEKIFTALTQGNNVDSEIQKLVGADYLIYGTINDFYIKTKRQNIALLGETLTSKKGMVNANLRIVDVHTGKVISAQNIHLNQTLHAEDDQSEIIHNLLNALTSRTVSKITTHLYPDELQPAATHDESTKAIRHINRPNF